MKVTDFGFAANVRGDDGARLRKTFAGILYKDKDKYRDKYKDNYDDGARLRKTFAGNS